MRFIYTVIIYIRRGQLHEQTGTTALLRNIYADHRLTPAELSRKVREEYEAWKDSIRGSDPTIDQRYGTIATRRTISITEA